MNGADRFGFNLLLGAALVVGLVPTLVGSAQAREEESVEDVGVVTIQAASPKTPTVGRPYTFTVFVKNNSVAQRVELEDLLPTSVSLNSATPSQGNCDYRSVSARDIVQCAFGVVRSGSTAEVELVVTPTAPGDITNTATATAEVSPATPGNSSSASVRVKSAPIAGA